MLGHEVIMVFLYNCVCTSTQADLNISYLVQAVWSEDLF